MKLCSTIWYHANVGAAAITTRSVCDSRERKRGTHKAAKCSSPFSYSASEVEKVREMYPRGGSLSGGIIKGRQNSPVSGRGGGRGSRRDVERLLGSTTGSERKETKERRKRQREAKARKGGKKIGGREEGKEKIRGKNKGKEREKEKRRRNRRRFLYAFTMLRDASAKFSCRSTFHSEAHRTSFYR